MTLNFNYLFMKKLSFYLPALVLLVFCFPLTTKALSTVVEEDGGYVKIEGTETSAIEVDAESVATQVVASPASSEQPSTTALEGEGVETPTKLPSTFGWLWRGLQEKFSIWTTFDSVKRAEKQLKFAEENIRIADLAAQQSSNDKAQVWAERAVARANGLMAKVEEQKSKWVNNKDKNIERLLKNIATHELNKERVLDKIEGKLPADKLDKVRQLRESGLEDSKRLLNAINNENVPENIRQHLIDTKNRIEEHLQEVKDFRNEKEELSKQAQKGDPQAREVLEELGEERKALTQERAGDSQESRVQLEIKSTSGVPTGKVFQKVEQIREQAREHQEDVDSELSQ